MSLYWPPPNLLGLAPPNFSRCWNHIHFARYFDVFDHEGGPVWDSNVFSKSVTYRPTLSKFKGGPVKKNTLYLACSNMPNMANMSFTYDMNKFVLWNAEFIPDQYWSMSVHDPYLFLVITQPRPKELLLEIWALVFQCFFHLRIIGGWLDNEFHQEQINSNKVNILFLEMFNRSEFCCWICAIKLIFLVLRI